MLKSSEVIYLYLSKGMPGKVLMLIVLIVFGLLPLPSTIYDLHTRNELGFAFIEIEGDLIDRRSEEFHNINLYLKEGLAMDTEPPFNNTPSIIRFVDGDSVEFVAARPLYGNLPVKGDNVGNENCFEFFITTIYTGNAEASITIEIMDGQTEIASSTFSDEEFRSNPKKIFFIPDAAPDQTYTFQKDNHIRIRMNVSIEDGPGPVLDRVVTVSFDSTNTDSHLVLFSHQIREITHDTYKDEVKTDTFEPNLPDSKRYLEVKGDVVDIMGDYDIREIDVIVLDPELTQIDNTTADLQRGEEDDKVSFTVRWEYDAGHPAGTYTIKVVIIDNNLNHVNSTLSFKMAKYGVCLSCDEYERSGLAGSQVSFLITVRNTGGLEDIFMLEHKVAPSIWSTSMDEEIGVSGGLSGPVGLVVTVPANAKEGDICTIEVTATSRNAPDVKDSLPKPIKVTAVTQYMFTVELTGNNEKQIENGGAASYPFKVSNIGDKDDSIIIEVPQPPRDWNAEIVDDIEKISSNGTYPYIYLLELPKNAEESVTLKVTAPETPTDNIRAELTLVLTSRNESLMTRSMNTITTTPTSVEEKLELDPKDTENTSDYNPVKEEFNPAVFKVEIPNNGLEEWQVDMAVDHDEKYSRWVVDCPTSVIIPPGSKKMITLSITPPPDEKATEEEDDGVVFTLEAGVRGRESLNMRHSRPLFVRVGKFYSLSFRVKGDSEKSINKGGKESKFELELQNDGNGIDEIRLEHEDPSNWAIKFSPEVISLEPGAVDTVKVTVISPKDSKDGDSRPITLIAKRDGKKVKEVTIKVTVEIGPKEHFASLLKDGVFWMIIGLFAAVVYLFFRGQHSLKK